MEFGSSVQLQTWPPCEIEVMSDSFNVEAIDDVLPENMMITMMIIQFSSIIYYLCAESTATRPITDPTQCRYR
jgi:hypothetical protein